MRLIQVQLDLEGDQEGCWGGYYNYEFAFATGGIMSSFTANLPEDPTGRNGTGIRREYGLSSEECKILIKRASKK